MDTEYVILNKPMSFYHDWVRELQPFREKYAGRIVAEGVNFGVCATCWLLIKKEDAKPAPKKTK